MSRVISDFLGIFMGSVFLTSGMKYDSVFLLILGASLWYVVAFYTGREYEKRNKRN
jgi:hypothetical protein